MKTTFEQLNNVLSADAVLHSDPYEDHFHGIVEAAYQILLAVEVRSDAAAVLLERSWNNLRYSYSEPCYVEAALPVAELAFHFAEIESRDLPELDNCSDEIVARLQWQLDRALDLVSDLHLVNDPSSPEIRELQKQALSLIPEVEEAIAEEVADERYLQELRVMTTDDMLGTGYREAKTGADDRRAWQDM